METTPKSPNETAFIGDWATIGTEVPFNPEANAAAFIGEDETSATPASTASETANTYLPQQESSPQSTYEQNRQRDFDIINQHLSNLNTLLLQEERLSPEETRRFNNYLDVVETVDLQLQDPENTFSAHRIFQNLFNHYNTLIDRSVIPARKANYMDKAAFARQQLESFSDYQRPDDGPSHEPDPAQAAFDKLAEQFI